MNIALGFLNISLGTNLRDYRRTPILHTGTTPHIISYWRDGTALIMLAKLLLRECLTLLKSRYIYF